MIYQSFENERSNRRFIRGATVKKIFLYLSNSEYIFILIKNRKDVFRYSLTNIGETIDPTANESVFKSVQI